MAWTRSRTLAATASVLALGLALGACGDGAPGTGETKADPLAEGRITVVFWQGKFQDQEDDWYKDQVKAFNDSQDQVFIDHQLIPADAWDQKMKASQASNTQPDIYTRAYNQLGQLKDLDAITDLSTLLPEDAWADLEPNVADMVTIDGEKVAYPILVEPSMLLWYRADLFEAAGLDPDAPPATWDEIVSYGEKLTDGQNIFGMNLAANATDMGWSTWGLQWNAAGHLPISDDWATAEATDPSYEKLSTLYRDLFSKGIMPQQELAPYADAAPFGEGKFAMMACGSWAWSTLVNDYPEIAESTRVAKFPSVDGDPAAPSATLGGWSLVIDGKSEHPQEAADFIYSMLGSDTSALEDYFGLTQYSKFPARTSVNDAIAADPQSAEVNPYRDMIATDVVPVSKPEPVYDWTISVAFSEALEKAMQGEDAGAAFAQAQKTIETQIDSLEIAGKGPGAS